MGLLLAFPVVSRYSGKGIEKQEGPTGLICFYELSWLDGMASTQWEGEEDRD